MKAKRNIFGSRKSKKGFTLIELLIVMVILAILAGVVIMAVGGVFGSARSAAYDGVASQVGTAVGAYAAQNAGLYPIGTTWGVDILDRNGATVPHASLFMINMSLLLTGQDGMFRTVPDGVIDRGAATADNCGPAAGTKIGGCSDAAGYLWLVNNNTGVTYSICFGDTCLFEGVQTENRDGFMGRWP